MLISLATVAAVLVTPALPELSRIFHLSTANSQWTMTSFLFGFSLGPLIYGPLGNRIGRKKSILLGLAISIVGSGLALVADSFWILCIGRFIQALGAAVGLKITFTMVGDLHTGPRAIEVLSLLLLGIAIAPSIGVSIGGFLTVAFTWKGCFAFLMLYSLLLLVLCSTLPETAKQLDPEALEVRRIAHNYLKQFKNPLITLHALIMGLSIAVLYVFANEAPYIAIELMGISPEKYGLFNLLLPIGMCLGLLLGNRFANKIPSRQAMFYGILLALAGALAMTACLVGKMDSGWSLFIPQIVILMGTYFLWLFASSAGLSMATDKSNASAVMQFINLGCATAATFLIGIFAPKAILTLPIVTVLLVLLTLLVWYFLGKYPKYVH
jgi:predicted MFS family arabinose efflux permease